MNAALSGYHENVSCGRYIFTQTYGHRRRRARRELHRALCTGLGASVSAISPLLFDIQAWLMMLSPTAVSARQEQVSFSVIRHASSDMGSSGHNKVQRFMRSGSTSVDAGYGSLVAGTV